MNKTPVNAISCVDHRGISYPSLTAMCKAYNISPESYKERLSKGMSQEEALTKSKHANRKCIDPWGKKFNSKTEMYRYHGVERKTYEYRLAHGCDEKTALMPGHRQKKMYVVNGKSFESIAELCRYYKKDYTTVKDMLKREIPVEDAIKERTRGIPCKDHLGNEYPNKKAMCEAYKITVQAFSDRIKKGWSLKKALTTPIAKANKILPIDHLGNKYSSLKAMCDYYNIHMSTFQSRMRNNWPLERALTEPIKIKDEKQVVKDKKPKNIYRDSKGREFTSLKAICAANNTTPKAVKKKLATGMLLEQALVSNKKRTVIITDTEGNSFESIKAMCKAHKITVSRYYTGKKAGWPIEKILSNKDFSRSKVSTDYNGISYPSESAMCKAHGINRTVYRKYLEQGMTSEQALKMAPHKGKICTDHLGNHYESIVEMCNVYGQDPHCYRDRITRLRWSVEEALLLKPGRMYNQIHVDKLSYIYGNTRNYLCACKRCGWHDIADFSEIQSHKCG